MVCFNFICICNSSWEFNNVLTMHDFCSHLMVYLKLFVDYSNALMLCSFLSEHVCMYAQGNNVFYWADEYEFQYKDTASRSKMGLGPTDISHISSYEFFTNCRYR
jgi:hypothetical protein